MRRTDREPGEWIDGFLFVANRPILDFLNTRPLIEDRPTELLVDGRALERWLIAAGMAASPQVKARLRSWRESEEAAAFLKELIGFRERLREAVLRMEDGGAPGEGILKEVNARLLEYPHQTLLCKRHGKVVRETRFDPRKPADFWTLFAEGAADLLAEPERSRVRKCESCVVHFFDTSKKGSRRWCSMNLCGNKLKVAAYQRRKREQGAG